MRLDRLVRATLVVSAATALALSGCEKSPQPPAEPQPAVAVAPEKAPVVEDTSKAATAPAVAEVPAGAAASATVTASGKAPDAAKYKVVPVPAPDKKTERIWKAKCSSCHGPEGKGNTEQGKKMGIPDFTSEKWQTAQDDEELKNAILNGVSKTEGGVKKEMSPFKDELSPEQADALVKAVRYFGTKH